jgi:hypothetical protein
MLLKLLQRLLRISLLLRSCSCTSGSGNGPEGTRRQCCEARSSQRHERPPKPMNCNANWQSAQWGIIASPFCVSPFA